MKNLLICLFLSLTVATVQLSETEAQTVQLQWNQNPEANIAGYRLGRGTSHNNYTTITNVGNTLSTTVNNLTLGTTYYFALKAYDTNTFESGWGQEISYLVPTVTGFITFCNTNLPAPNIVVVLTGTINLTDTTDPNGKFTFDVPLGTPFTLTPIAPSPLPPGNSNINTADVVAIQSIYLGYSNPACFETADINSDSKINTIDIIATQQFVLGRPSQYVGVYGFKPTTVYNYKIFVKGDVVGSNLRATSQRLSPLRTRRN